MPRSRNSPPALQSAPPPDARRRQARSLSTRELLLESARTCFGERGYQATPIKDIASDAGVTVGAFYAHFASKRDLLIALMSEVLDWLDVVNLRPAAGRMTRLALRAHFQALFRDDPRPYRALRSWREAILVDGELAAMNAKVERWSERNIVRLLQHLSVQPNVRKDRDYGALAAMINRYMWDLLTQCPSIREDEFQRQIGILGDIIYYYVFRDARSRSDD